MSNKKSGQYLQVFINEEDVQKRLDIEVVGGKDNLKEHFLINRDKLLVPFADVRCPLACFVLALVCVWRRQGLTAMVFAVFENLRNMSHLRFRSQYDLNFTFFNTLDETLGRGIGWSDSPTSRIR